MESKIGIEHPTPEDVLALLIGYEKEADLLDLETAALEKEADALLSEFHLEELEDECKKLEAAADTLEMAAAMAAAAMETESEEGSDYEDILRTRRIVVSPGKKSRNPRTKVTFRIPPLVAPPDLDKRTLILEKSKRKTEEGNRSETQDSVVNEDETKTKRKPARFSRARSAAPRIESTEHSPAVSSRRKHRCERKSWEEEAKKEAIFPVSSIRVGRKWRQKRWARLQRMWRRRERRWRKRRLEALHATTIITLIEADGTAGCSYRDSDSTNTILTSPLAKRNT